MTTSGAKYKFSSLVYFFLREMNLAKGVQDIENAIVERSRRIKLN